MQPLTYTVGAPYTLASAQLASSGYADTANATSIGVASVPTAAPAPLTRILHGRPQAGDLLFYSGRGSLVSRLIQWWTHGPYVHCEVALSATEAIGALTSGIDRHAIQPGFVLVRTSSVLQSIALQTALGWLERQVGLRYGWPDIGDNIIKRLLPTHGLFLVDPHAFDCSHLCADFLVEAAYPDAPTLFANPEAISPNGLMRALVDEETRA